MAIPIGRREFAITLGGAVMTLPLAAHAQQPTMPVIGFLGSSWPADRAHKVTSRAKGSHRNLGGLASGRRYNWAERYCA
jgi:putative ABC transport system substrate-binding protein